MLSQFAKLTETDKKIFIAKIIHNINYSQSSFETMEAMVQMWEQYPIRIAKFFTQTIKITNGTAKN
jgi:hypothetical protein